MSSDRISRPELFMATARLFGQRSTCPRAQVGAIAVNDGRIIATGYVGAPAGQDHCTEVGCEIENDHCRRTVHAEANLVAFAAYEGISLHEATIYSTYLPCYDCAKLLINCGVIEIVFDEDYADHRGLQLFYDLEVEVTRYYSGITPTG